MPPRPSTIQILLHDGTPSGVRSAEPESDLRGFAIPRGQLRALANDEVIPQSNQVGVYILEGVDDQDGLGRAAYVGEGDFRSRIRAHSANNTGDRLDWDTAYAFTSPRMNRAHAKFIEQNLFDAISEVPLIRLVNGNRPSGDQLSGADRVRAMNLLEDIQVLLPVLGAWVLEAPMQVAEPRPDNSTVEASPTLPSSSHLGAFASRVPPLAEARKCRSGRVLHLPPSAPRRIFRPAISV